MGVCVPYDAITMAGLQGHVIWGLQGREHPGDGTDGVYAAIARPTSPLLEAVQGLQTTGAIEPVIE